MFPSRVEKKFIGIRFTQKKIKKPHNFVCRWCKGGSQTKKKNLAFSVRTI